MPVKDFGEACEDPQIKARNMVVEIDHPIFGSIQNIASPIKYSRTPLTIRNLAPKMGHNTKEILQWLNYTPDEIKGFKKRGTI
jgi:crotonobetainyl-CoA:carnitine CoA-transferase CaiB-like acyl-CoA transferase